VTDYILEQPAKCPNWRREILEKTLIEPHNHGTAGVKTVAETLVHANS
jgi:hypothetical protein